VVPEQDTRRGHTADHPLSGESPPAPPAPGGSTASRRAGFGATGTWWRHHAEGVLTWVTGAAAVLPGLALAGVLVALLVEAIPAIRGNGLGFLTRSTWEPGNFYNPPVTIGGVARPAGASYGAWPLIVGTLESSLVAIVVAVPVAFGTAMVVVWKLPRRLSAGIGFCLELLAGIPSVVFGLWAALTLGPFLSRHVFPFVSQHTPDVPPLSFLHGPAGSGEGLATSGLVLAVMVVPIIASTSRDLLRQVPRGTEEGAVALGMTDLEVARTVSIPWVRAGVLGACVLGLARALGETMAVAMASGVVLGTVPHDAYATFGTIASVIVSQLDSALTDGTGFAIRTLAELGLVLMGISLLVNVVARLLVRRSSSVALPVGRGI
jgi:phosphate transport system permease protein